ncbi:MAG: pantoate--beta-alanine ligase [Spirochaetia bacterium]|nr:pantoate--beta-alanine ligase [Spirochaetia bacterium]
MKVIRTIHELRQEIKNFRSVQKGRSVSLVPTMGFLHEGHLALIRESKKKSDLTVVSIFVNKLQFNDSSDFTSYPSDQEGDLIKCENEGVDILFAPSSEELFRTEPMLKISLPELSRNLCGKFRPGHFEGVLYVIIKFFNIINPDLAIFGKKDYQQYILIREMSEELNFSVSVEGFPTVREEDGLAKSSRNARLSEKARSHANLIFRALKIVEKTFHDGNREPSQLSEIGKDVIESGSMNRVEYFDLVDPFSLQLIASEKDFAELSSFVIACAVYCDGIRLIDNIEVNFDERA